MAVTQPWIGRSASKAGADLDATFTVARGGTGITTFALGDTLYSDAANSLAKLAGNTTATKKFLRQTGNGVTSAAPAWDTVAAADVAAGTFTGAFTFATGFSVTSGLTTLQSVSATSITATLDVMAGAAQAIGWTGRSKMTSPSDGVITLLDSAAATFVRAQLGGTTAAFPAIKRSGTDVHFRLADDSAFTNTQMAGLTATSGTFSGDVQLNNASYFKGKLNAGTATRMLGINSGDVLFLGSVDAAIASMNFNANGVAWLALTGTTAVFNTTALSGISTITTSGAITAPSINATGAGTTFTLGLNFRTLIQTNNDNIIVFEAGVNQDTIIRPYTGRAIQINGGVTGITSLDVTGGVRLGSAGGNVVISIGSAAPAADNGGRLIFQNTNAVHNWQIDSNIGASDSLSFTPSTANGGSTFTTPVFKLSSGGTGTLVGLLDLSGAAAGQVKFPAAQNASANANTLDDYEEGTWTPSVGGTATYTTQLGTYVKIGRLVHLQFKLVINAIGTGSTSVVSGLPFSEGGGAGIVGGSVGYFSGLAITPVFLQLDIPTGTSTMSTVDLTAANATATQDPALFQNAARLEGSITYYASA